jgi:hypothetical protein
MTIDRIFIRLNFSVFCVFVMCDSESKYVELCEKLDSLALRVEQLDRSRSRSESREHSEHERQTQPRGGSQQGHIPRRDDEENGAFGSTEDSVPSAAEALREYDRVRDSLQRIRIPNEVRLFDSQTGIKHDCKDILKVVSKCGRFTETAFKWIIDIQSQGTDGNGTHQVSSHQLEDLFTILVGEITFLRGEYSSLLVKSTFNEETSRLFRSLECNQTSFTPRSLQNVRIAAELAGIQSRQNHTTRQRGRGRGRGSFMQRRDDTFSAFSRRNVGQFSRRGYSQSQDNNENFTGTSS